jgi:hypothetical protein
MSISMKQSRTHDVSYYCAVRLLIIKSDWSKEIYQSFKTGIFVAPEQESLLGKEEHSSESGPNFRGLKRIYHAKLRLYAIT